MSKKIIIQSSDSNDENDSTEEPTILLQLGDIIRIKRGKGTNIEENEQEPLEQEIYLIDYLDKSKLKLIDTKSFDTLILNIKSNGLLSDESIKEIDLLNRNEFPGYAKQNDLLPKTWINIYFNGDVPHIITGQITNLEEDMIEIKTFPDKEIIYINFDYKGIPEDIPIENIEIRQPPEQIITREKELSLPEFEKEGEETAITIQNMKESIIVEEAEKEYIPIEEPSVKDNIRQFLLKADEIEFGQEEEFGPINQYIEMEQSKQRFSIEMQSNDLLNEMLSTIPAIQRTSTVLNNIHTMIERFKQLRTQFSTFDQNYNIEGPIVKKANWRPLTKELLEFKQILYWLLPVVKNVKKIYGKTTDIRSDVQILDKTEELLQMSQIFQNYKSNNFPEEQNKYSAFINELNPLMTPFESVDPENIKDIIYETHVQNNIQCIVDNLDDFYSSVSKTNSSEDDTKRFLLQKYNTGLEKLVASQFTGGRMISKRTQLTEPDDVSIKSIMFLPEPIIRFSKINLPGTTILDRSNLNTNFLNYWQLLKKNTIVNNVIIGGTKEEEEEREENERQKVLKEGIEREGIEREGIEREGIEEKENEDKDKTKQNNDVDSFKNITNYICATNCNYENYLEKIIPQTKILFQFMKKYITGAVSLIDTIKFLEPFLIYTNDLTYQQYKEINKYINGKISEYNKNIVEKGRAFASLKTIKVLDYLSKIKKFFLLCNILTDDTLKNEVFQEGGYECQEKYTNSEMLSKIMKIDSGNLLNSAIAIETTKLMISQNFAILFDEERAKNGDSSSCISYILAKQYTSIEELDFDNNKEIYFDKRFDKTRYSIIDDYEKEMAKLPSDEFIDYLIIQLQKKEKLKPEDAVYLADTLITGVKKVMDGQYAFIFDISNKENLTYYKRINNKWIIDNTVDKSFFVNDDNLLCNVQKDCIEVNNKCENMNSNKFTLKENTIDEMMNEFDEKYILSKEEMENKIKQEFNYHLSMITKLKKMEYHQMFQYNDKQFKLGLSNDDDHKMTIVSPYNKLRDLILGQSDFVKKQNDIIKFTMEFTREANEYYSPIKQIDKEEDEHWRYCIKTGVKLLPCFLHSIASSFVNDQINYNKHVEYLIKDIGALSDDGDAWVDKYSGYVIKPIDFDIEEGYEEGFKITSRSILEQDASNLIKIPKIDTPEVKTISNIVITFSNSLGIKLDEQREFIIKQVSIALEQSLPSEKAYKKQVQEIMKKGKKEPPSYKDLYNSTILYLTIGMILIAIQTSIPSIKSRKTFPGCIRSFNGYPIEGAGDDSAVMYLACVSYNNRSIIEPWNVLMKRKETFIVERIKDSIQKNFLEHPDILRKFQEKTEYLLVNQEKDIPEEHNIIQWKQFLPPLIPFKLQNLANITSEFKSKLLKDLKSGYKGQFESLDVIQSKIIFFSFRIQEIIQKIVEREKPLLTNMANQAFMENACCNLGSYKTTLDYFIEKDGEIATCNQIVEELSNTLEDVNNLSKASLFYSQLNTKNIYPGIINNFNEETIYLTFIHFCNYTNYLPIKEDLISLCNEKPEYLKKSDTIQEMIKKLKNDGKIYTNEMLLRLLQIVNRNNILHVSLNTPIIAPVQQIRNIIEDLNDQDDEIIDQSLRNLMEETLDTFDLAIEKDTIEMRNLKNHLARTNNELRNEIIEFINKNNTVIGGSKLNIEELLNNLMKWSIHKKSIYGKMNKKGEYETNENDSEEDEDENIMEKTEKTKSISDNNGYNSIQFIKSYLQNFIQTFPNIIINKVDNDDVRVPQYWKLSGYHDMDIRKIISEYYKDLRQFYNNNTLNNILKNIQEKAKNILLLGKETPYFSDIHHYDDTKITHSVFDKRTNFLLFEQYFLLTLLQYKNLTENENMLFDENIQEEKLENVFDIEDLIESNTNNDRSINRLQQQKSSQQLKTNVANLLLTYLQIMKKHKELVNGSYENIMDRVFKLQEREKNTFTDRLKGLTDEERNVDNILKSNKLGVWSKGLQKGLTMYDKDVYDDERDAMDKITQIENNIRQQNGNVDDFDVEDAMEEMDRELEIERDAYDMSDMNDDYDNGNFGGDEVDDYNNYD